MRRSLLAISIFSLLSASSLFASPESDLLSKATDGAIVSAKAEGVKVLSSDEMGDVKGGYYQYLYPSNTSMYKMSIGKITEGYMGYQATMYARRMSSNGYTTVGIQYIDGSGRQWTAFGNEANRLTNLYRSQAIAAIR